MISNRVSAVQPSATMEMSALARDMKAKGEDVVNLTAGEPDFDTPNNIKKAAIVAINSGFTKYTSVPGIPSLKRAVCEKFERDNGLQYSPKDVIVSCGAKHILYNAMQALLDQGDEVVIPLPYWVSYSEQVRLAEGKPVFAETENCEITAKSIKRALTDKTKLIILNSPNNPSGFVFEKDELRKIAKLAVENNIYVLSDEIYEKIIYEKKHYSIASFSDEIKNLTVTINGVSKSHSMTGWRIGYAAANEKITKAMSVVQSHSTSNPASIAQKAALEALTGPQDFVEIMRKEFMKRRNHTVSELNSIDGLSCQMPHGAFYVFPDISKISNNSLKFSMDLLKKEKVATVPGKSFGAEGFIRISYATSIENINKGLERLKQFVGEYR